MVSLSCDDDNTKGWNKGSFKKDIEYDEFSGRECHDKYSLEAYY